MLVFWLIVSVYLELSKEMHFSSQRTCQGRFSVNNLRFILCDLLNYLVPAWPFSLGLSDCTTDTFLINFCFVLWIKSIRKAAFD